jgi:hypothetical protein
MASGGRNDGAFDDPKHHRDPEQRQKTQLAGSRFARTAAALAEVGIAVEEVPYIAGDAEALRQQ